MKYSHLITKLFNEPALILPSRHAALCLLMDRRLAGTMAEAPDESERGGDPEIDLIGQTAVIPVHGTIVQHPEDIAMSECGCALEKVRDAIDMVEADDNVANVIFDFRTPGGTVTGVPETARKIYQMRKRAIAFTSSQCCSAGIWLASQCPEFYATASASVGSVGVYTMTLDLTRQMKEAGVQINALFAGKYKLLGAYWKELSAEERDLLQRGVDKTYTQFKQAMETRRVVHDEHFGNGLVFDGEEAAEIGFIDGTVEGLEEVIDGLAE